MIQEFKAVAFENDELDFRDMSELKAFLLFLANQDYDSNVEIKFKGT